MAISSIIKMTQQIAAIHVYQEKCIFFFAISECDSSASSLLLRPNNFLIFLEWYANQMYVQRFLIFNDLFHLTLHLSSSHTIVRKQLRLKFITLFQKFLFRN